MMSPMSPSPPPNADPANSVSNVLAATLSFAPPDALDATYRHTPLSGGIRKSVSVAMAKKDSKGSSPLGAGGATTTSPQQQQQAPQGPPSTVSILIKLAPWLRDEDRDHHHTLDADRCPHACPISIHLLSSLMRSIAFISSDPPPRTKSGPRTFLIRVSPGGNAVEGRCKIATSILPSLFAVANAVAPAKRDLVLLAASGAVSESTSIPYEPIAATASVATESKDRDAESSGHMISSEGTESVADLQAVDSANVVVQPSALLQPHPSMASPAYAAVVAKGIIFPFKSLVPIGDISLRKGFARIEISSATFNPLTDELKLSELGKSFHVRPPHKLFTANGMYCGTLSPIYFSTGGRGSVASPLMATTDSSATADGQALPSNPIRGYHMTFDSNCRATTHILQSLIRSLQYTCTNPFAVSPNGINWKRTGAIAVMTPSNSTAPSPVARSFVAPSPPPSSGLLSGGIGRRNSLATAFMPLAPATSATPNAITPSHTSAPPPPIGSGRISRASSMAAMTTAALLGTTTGAAPQHEGIDEFGAVRPNMGLRVFNCVVVDGPNAATEVTKVEVKVFMPNSSDFKEVVNQSVALHLSASRASGYLTAQQSPINSVQRRSRSEEPAPLKPEEAITTTSAGTNTEDNPKLTKALGAPKRASAAPAPPSTPKSVKTSVRNSARALPSVPIPKVIKKVDAPPPAPFIIRSTTTTSAAGRPQSPNRASSLNSSHNGSFRGSLSRNLKSPDSAKNASYDTPLSHSEAAPGQRNEMVAEAEQKPLQPMESTIPAEIHDVTHTADALPSVRSNPDAPQDSTTSGLIVQTTASQSEETKAATFYDREASESNEVSFENEDHDSNVAKLDIADVAHHAAVEIEPSDEYHKEALAATAMPHVAAAVAAAMASITHDEDVSASQSADAASSTEY